eukprot:15254586-Ditylum_brightwellii.AAC.1
MLVVIVTITTAQSKGTEAMAKAVEHLLDYCVSHPNTTIRYTPKAHSRVGGYFFLGSATDNNMNKPLLAISTILHNMMALAAEAELGTLF